MTLKTKILVLTLITVLLVVVAMVLTSRLTQGQIEQRFENATVTGESMLWDMILNSQMDLMQTTITTLVRNRYVRRALAEEDFDNISERLEGTYESLAGSGVLTGIIVTDTGGRSVAVMPDGEAVEHADIPLATMAIESKQIQRGLITGPDGRLSVAVAFPLIEAGEGVGAGIYVHDLEKAISIMGKSNNSEVAIIDPNGSMAYQTNAEVLNNLGLTPLESGDYSIRSIKSDQFVLSAVTQPIKNAAGETLAYLVNVKDYTESYNRQTRFTWISFLIDACIVVVMLGFTLWYIRHSFSKLQSVISIVKDIATGDLTPKDVRGGNEDETGQLMKAMSSMLENLNLMVVDLGGTSNKMTTSANTLTSVVKRTESSIEQQLSQTGMVAAAIHQLSASSQEMAKNATDAASAAERASEETRQGTEESRQLLKVIQQQRQEVQAATESQARVQQQTEEISKIMIVITGIAEQTNLLALNAAIEAARAGEQGRGFAVVADEVRTLAARTQKATVDISDMITRLQRESASAGETMNNANEQALKTEEFVDHTSTRLHVIEETVNTIHDMVMQIASATEQQTAVTEEINTNVTSINQLAEEVSRGSHETNEAVESINQISVELDDMIHTFRT